MSSILPDGSDSNPPPPSCEESVDLTPGVVWTDSQLDVIRELTARIVKAEAALRRLEDEISEEVTFAEEFPAWEITVAVPLEAGDETYERIFDAVADAAYDAEPEDRNGWDVFTSATKRPMSVPVHILRRALDGVAR